MRLDPLSIPYRGIRLGLQWAVGAGTIGLIIASVIDIQVAGPVALLVVVAAGLGGTVWAVAYHRRFEYELTDESLDITSGVIARRTREIPVGRIQNVDIRQGVVPRLLGLAEVRFETAGGRGTEASLRYVDLEVARELQDHIDRHGEPTEAEVTDDRTEAADTAGDRPADELLYAISPVELAILSVTSIDWRAIGFVVLAAVGIVPDAGVPGFDGSVLAPLVLLAQPLALTMAGVLANAALLTARFYRFRLWRTGETLRYERGLFRRYSGSIPLDRVHLLRLRDNPATRRFGFAALDIETAGYGPDSEAGSAAAIPIATRDDVVDLARSIESIPRIDLQRPPSRARHRYIIRYTMVATLLTAGLFAVDWFVRSLPWELGLGFVLIAPIGAHLTWRHRGYVLGERALVVRSGFWRRTTDVVPLYRVQTVGTTATVFQRRWSLATVRIDTASGTPAAHDLDATTARELQDAIGQELLADRARRRVDGQRHRDPSTAIS